MTTTTTKPSDWRRLMRSFIMMAALLCAALPTRAADYVLAYVNGNTTYYLARNGTTGVQRVTTFNPATCIWSCASDNAGTTAGTLNNSNTYGYLYQTVNGTRYFLNASANALGLGTNANTNYYRWRTNGTYVYNRYSGTYSYYINLANGVARNTTANTTSNARPYEVTTSTVESTSTPPTINGANALSAAGTSNYTASGAAYQIGYSNYRFNNADHNYDANGASFTGTPAAANVSYSWTLTSNSYASVNNSGVVTVSSLPATDVVLTLTATATFSGGTPAVPGGTTLSATKEILLQGTTVAAPTITRSGNSVTLATASTGATIYYTTDGSTPSSSSAVYSGPINIANLSFPVTVKAIAIRNGNSSDPASETYSQPACEEPVITVSSTGVVTITCATEGATIRYTSGASPADPTGSSPVFSTLTLTSGQSVKAIATKSGYINSAVATAEYVQSGVSGGNVILDDREDHAWSYYSDPDCPIRSLSPADVKITYYGDGIVMTGNADYTSSSTDFIQPGNANYEGGAKVNVGGEDENTFIYYKTLERTDGSTSANPTGRCPYTTIPNPFQVRPTYGARDVDANNFTGWRGFQCWRLKSVTGGSVYSAASGGTALTTGAVINGETEIYFAPNSEYGMDVQFEAVWARAYLIKGNQSGANTILSQNVGVERNFMTLTTNENYRFNGTDGRRITNIGYPVTISCYYPSGEAPDNTSGVVSGNNSNITLGADTKFENVTVNVGGNYVSANGYDLIIGRGCTVTANTIQGLSSNSTTSFRMRIESGSCNNLYFMGASSLTSGVLTSVLGSDYDRAKNDNSKIRVTNDILVSNQGYIGSNTNVGADAFYCIAKSGDYYLTSDNPGGGYQFYLSSPQSNRTYGKRTLVIEGGRFSDIAGGLDMAASTTMAAISNLMVDIRIKGGQMDGAVYGAAQYSNAAGNRRFVITGGNFTGWIAGGANGTQNTGGRMAGASYIYVGGNANVNSNSSSTLMNRAVGGNVFGAGCGYSGTSTSGQVTEGTTVVVADEAYVERGVYGGGSYGYTTSTADVFILGGTVDGKSGGVSGTSYSGTITGGVFGGACQNQGGTVNITMTGGEVHTGLYGGSNATGTISGNVTMQVDGGQVGTSTTDANVHGGGYGANTAVNGNVSLTLGASTSATDSVTVFGNVYGGSALGDVNDNANDNTTVTMNKALINGNLFGGALGNGAAVTGRITVNVNGGRVNGNVFGGGNEAAYSHGGDFPVVNMTGGLVTNIFGGGKGGTATVTGNPQVTLSGNAHVTGNVYGGGDAAQVSGQTNVILRD